MQIAQLFKIMDRQIIEQAAGILAVIAAYAFLLLIRLCTFEFAHTYEHWLEGMSFRDLPQLTTHVLPFIGISAGASADRAVALIGWLAAAIWPGFALVIFLRASHPNRVALLSVNLFTWLLLFLTAGLVISVGLWLPFSLL